MIKIFLANMCMALNRILRPTVLQKGMINFCLKFISLSFFCLVLAPFSHVLYEHLLMETVPF